MGNSESLHEATKVNSENKQSITDHITISIRGSRKTGKTALVTRMQAKKLYPDYSQTPVMEATDFIWEPVNHDDEHISVTIWDVPDHAIRYLDVDPNKELPDATTVDTFARADGVVVVYDSRDPNTIKNAAKIIRSIPEGLPTIVCSNFADKIKDPCGIPPEIKEFDKRIIHVHTSMVDNIGLGTVAKWLEMPLIYHKRKRYSEIIQSTEKDFEEMQSTLYEAFAEENSYDRNESGRRVYTVPEEFIIKSEDQVDHKLPGRPTFFGSEENEKKTIEEIPHDEEKDPEIEKEEEKVTEEVTEVSDKENAESANNEQVQEE